MEKRQNKLYFILNLMLCVLGVAVIGVFAFGLEFGNALITQWMQTMLKHHMIIVGLLLIFCVLLCIPFMIRLASLAHHSGEAKGLCNREQNTTNVSPGDSVFKIREEG